LVGALFEHGFFEADVSKTFLRGWVGDMGSRLFGCTCGGGNEDSCETVGGEEAG
jgi:hypothetical protein